MDGRCEVQDKETYEPYEKPDIIQAVYNASCCFKREANDKKEDDARVREVAVKWDGIAQSSEGDFNSCGKTRLIGVLLHCLTDIRYLKAEETTCISNVRVRL